MVYIPTKPEAGDKLSESQPIIQGNFAQADTSIGVDHFEFSDATGDTGKHKATTFVDLDSKSLSAPTTSASEFAIFSKQVSSVPQLFYRKPSDGQQIQISSVNVVDSQNGQSPLPGGVNLKWGRSNVTSTASVAFTYSLLGLTDFSSATYSLVVTGFSAGQVSSFRVVALSKTGFTLQATASTYPCTLNWMAIGK